jgi:SIT4-associating protein SAP185/190
LTSPNAFNPNGGNGGDQPEAGVPASDGPSAVANANTGSPVDSGSSSTAIPNNATNDSVAANGQRDNRLIRELVTPQNIAMLVEPMKRRLATLDGNDSDEECDRTALVEVDLHDRAANTPADKSLDVQTRDASATYSFDPYEVTKLPSVASVTSSFCQSITILIELIRKNNSDYSEPYLFHSIRNRLMGMQQRKVEIRFQAKDQAEQEDKHTSSLEEDAQDRQDMEDTMAKMSEKLGIVHLGPLLSQVSERIGDLQEAILHARHPVSRVITFR